MCIQKFCCYRVSLEQSDKSTEWFPDQISMEFAEEHSDRRAHTAREQLPFRSFDIEFEQIHPTDGTGFTETIQ